MKTYHYSVKNGKATRLFDEHEPDFAELCPTDRFVEREDINEFLRDGSLINALYDQTINILFEQGNLHETPNRMSLRVLNSAYKMCWLITAQNASYAEVSSQLYFQRGDYLARDLSYYVAWSILKVYGQFYEFNDDILESIRRRTGHKELFSQFRELVRMQDDPSRPICFSCPGVRLPEREDFFEFCDDSECHDPKAVFQFLQEHMSSPGPHTIMTNLDEDEEDEQDEELEMTPIDDIIDQSVNTIKCMCKTVQAENLRLARAMEEMESTHKEKIETLESTNERLRARVRNLTRQLEEKETKVVTKEVVKVKEVTKEHPLLKILNWDSITDYALGLGNPKDVQVILNMLNRISTRNHYFDDNLDANIEKLETYLRELQKPAAPHVEGDYVIEKNVGQETYAHSQKSPSDIRRSFHKISNAE